MISFWLISAAMLLLAMLFFVLPLWRKTTASHDVLRDAANLGILRDQTAELEKDFRNGLLTQEAFEQGKRELQARLVEEVGTSGLAATKPHNPNKTLAIALAVLLPIASVPLYLTLGNTDALVPQGEITPDANGIIRSDEGLQQLEKKLVKNPNNPNDWWTLAQSYTELKRFSDAARAYENLTALVPGEAQLWANYADVYAMAHGQNMQDEQVTKLLNKSLELDSNNETALALSGSAAMDRGDYANALEKWQKLLDQMPPGSQEAQMFQHGADRARELLAKQPGGKEKLAQMKKAQSARKAMANNGGGAITGKVMLSPALAGKVSPSDTVFILARAAQGPKMPLAVLRKQVKDLPMQFALDDSMAMQPQLKLSGFDQVVVVARVSKSGSPMAQPGDLQGLSGTVKPGTAGLSLVIDTVVP